MNQFFTQIVQPIDSLKLCAEVDIIKLFNNTNKPESAFFYKLHLDVNLKNHCFVLSDFMISWVIILS